MAQRITYKYYVGRKAMFDSDFKLGKRPLLLPLTVAEHVTWLPWFPSCKIQYKILILKSNPQSAPSPSHDLRVVKCDGTVFSGFSFLLFCSGGLFVFCLSTLPSLLPEKQKIDSHLSPTSQDALGKTQMMQVMQVPYIQGNNISFL